MPAAMLACYSPDTFQGDGHLRDSGWCAYRPRFVITFPKILVNELRDHVYSFSGPPSAPLTLHLNVLSDRPEHAYSNSEWEEAWESLERAGTRVEVELTDADGRVACRAAAPLAGGWTPAGVGVPNSTDMSMSFWHSDCRDVRLRTREQYRLRVSARSDGTAPAITLVPSLEGGGRDAS